MLVDDPRFGLRQLECEFRQPRPISVPASMRSGLRSVFTTIWLLKSSMIQVYGSMFTVRGLTPFHVIIVTW